MKLGGVVAAWPHDQLRPIAVACGFALLAIIANAIWVPSVEPVTPAPMRSPTDDANEQNKLLAEESLDFIFRPLFLTSRRPIEQTIEMVPQQAEVAVAAEELVPMEGYQLLGIFSSDGVAGIIIETDQKEKIRLRAGEATAGWTLKKIDLRSAQFINDSGGTAHLDLAVASSLPLPMSSPNPAANKAVQSAPVTEQKVPADDRSDEGAMTFEAIAKRNERAMRANKAESSKTDGAN